MWMLNNDILIPIIAEWIEYEALGVLDTALTNRESRLTLLRLLRMKECFISSSMLWLDSCYDATLTWILRRGIRFKKISFTFDAAKFYSFIEIMLAQEDSLEELELMSLNEELIKVLPSLLKCCHKLKSIDLFQSYCMSDDDLAKIFNSVPSKERLTKLTLGGLSDITSDALRLVGETFPNIQHFEVYDCNVTAGLSNKPSTEFKKLQTVLVDRPDVHASVAEYVLSNAVQLQKLVTISSAVCNAASKSAKELQTLHLSFCDKPVTDSARQLFQNNRNTLSHVTLIENTIDDACLLELSTCRSLTFLSLESYESEPAVHFTLAGLAAALKQMPQLRHLSLQLAIDEQGQQVSESFASITSLQHLYLSGYHVEGAQGCALSNAQGVALASTCSLLRTLHLGPHGRLLEDSFVLAVAENLSLLRLLSLEAPMLTDGSVIQLISRCSRLDTLELNTSALLTHRTLLHIVAQAESLSLLTLCVDNLTATSVQSLVNARSALNAVYLRTTSDISRPKYKTFKQTIKLVKEMRPQLSISGVFDDVNCM